MLCSKLVSLNTPDFIYFDSNYQLFSNLFDISVPDIKFLIHIVNPDSSRYLACTCTKNQSHSINLPLNLPGNISYVLKNTQIQVAFDHACKILLPDNSQYFYAKTLLYSANHDLIHLQVEDHAIYSVSEDRAIWKTNHTKEIFIKASTGLLIGRPSDYHR